MNSEWPQEPLGDLVEDRGITYGVVQPGHPQSDGVPMVRVNNFGPTGLQLDEVMRIDPQIAAQHDRSRLRGNEVLITLVGTTGLVAVATSALEGWNVARAVGVIPVRDPALTRWIAWCLQTPQALAFMDSRLNTTVQKTLNLRDLALVSIPMPSQRERDSISAVLGAFDDKIDSNRRLYRLLEETAVTLFRARFVDFVGAKQFEDSQLGRIPKGWRPVSLEEAAEKTVGGVWGSDAPSAKSSMAVRCLRGIDVHALASGNVPDPPVRYVTPGQLEKRRLEPGDILVEGSGSSCGRSGMYQPSWQALYDEPLTYSNFCKRLRPAGGIAQSSIAWLHLRDAYERGITSRFRIGSAFPNLDLDGLRRSLKFAMPPEAELGDFASLFGLAFGTKLRIETRRLTAMRDALLAKLVNGEIRVR